MENEVVNGNVATGESNEVRKAETRNLVIILCTLAVLAVGLGVGIVINAVNGEQEETKQGEIEYALPEELMGDDLSPTDQVIKETTLMVQNPDYTYEDIEAYYDSVIDEALMSEDASLAVRIIIQKVNFLVVVEKNCAKAEDYADGLDLSSYSREQQAYLASYIVSITASCNDQDFQMRWEEFYNRVRSE